MEEPRSTPVLWLIPGSPERPGPGSHRPCVISGFASPAAASTLIQAMRAEGVQWIALAAHGSEIAWLRAGAWAVLGADSDREVAEETARCISARARAAVEGNPLTGLPGNPTIARFLEAEVIGREMLADNGFLVLPL